MRPVEPPSAPADRAVRREIVGEADRCFVVEAGAGTGKTSLLIERALHLIASQVPLERLAIITFTEKAAGELKIRLRQGIEARLRADPVRDAVYRAALEALDRATISTIHAFAATLLRERPVEARLDPQFRVLDEIEAGVLREETFERHRLESLTREDPDLEEILRHGVSERRVREIAMFAAENRDLSPPPPPPEADPPERLLRRFRERAGRLASLAGSCRDPDDRALRAIRRLHRLAEDLEEAEPRAASLRLLSDGKAPTRAGDRSNWEPRSALEEVRRIFRSLEEDREALLRLTGGRVAWRLGRWIARFTEKYEQALVRQAGLDFQGLLLKARDLVARDRSVRDDFQRRYRYLLVDEFQDTDPLQAEMLFLLAEPRPRAAQWRRAVPAGGRLFIVGDPKQSIYRFRRADIAVYQEARRLLERSGEGGLRRITANFRSVPSLVDWINRLFAPLIGAAADSDLQPAYAPIEASRAPLDDRPAVALLPVPEEAVPRTADAEGARQVEAALVASLLKRIVAEQRWTVQGRDGGRRGAGWEDIALLFRGMTGLGHFEEALRAREIPYRVAGGRTFYTRQETRHLLALLRAIDNPRDALSVAAALRSPFLGCDDQDLFLYVAAEPGGSFDYLREAERLPEGSPLGDAFRFLSDLHHLRNDRSPAATVDEILQRTGALALLLLGPQGDQRVANLAKLVDLARQHEIASGGGFRSFVAFLSSMVEQEHQEAESPTAEEDAALVRLMTVHQAKGLEFPIVVLADAAARPGHARGVHPDRRHGRYHFSLSLDEGGPRAGSWGFEEVDGREKEFSAAEQVRLLYVAATRARDHLIIPVVPPAGRYDSFLKLLREAGAIPDELRPGTCPAPGSAAALCRVLDCAGLDTSTPPPRQFRLDRDLPEQAARADEALLLERSAWKEDLGRALAAAARGRPIRVASALEGRILDAASAGGEAASLRPGAAGSGARPRERRLLVGAAVHAVLEAVPPVGAAAEIPLRAALAAEAARAGLTEEERREAERLVRAAYRSSLPSRAARAGRCEVEYPFAVTIGEEEGEPVLLEGRIDLLLVGDDGCVVIDYKTDRLGDGADSERILAERVALYRPQAAAYAAALAAAGARVRSVVLLFLDTGREVSLEADHALLALGRRAALSPPPPGRTDPPRG